VAWSMSSFLVLKSFPLSAFPKGDSLEKALKESSLRSSRVDQAWLAHCRYIQ
jgi:hypothetical protein